MPIYNIFILFLNASIRLTSPVLPLAMLLSRLSLLLLNKYMYIFYCLLCHIMCYDLSGVTCLLNGASFMLGELSWGKLSLGRVVLHSYFRSWSQNDSNVLVPIKEEVCQVK